MKFIRIIAILVGFGTVAWQMMEMSQGRGQNMFFWADIIVGIYLGAVAFLPNVRAAQVHMLAGFGLMSGIYLVATLGTIAMEGALNEGATSTLIGLIFTLPSMTLLGRKLVRS
ncbi:MAG: hypothetical protein AAFP97_09090 [Pseudomonadota bacterium]